MKKLFVMTSLPISLLCFELCFAQGNNSLTLTSKKSTTFPLIQPVAATTPVPAPTAASRTVSHHHQRHHHYHHAHHHRHHHSSHHTHHQAHHRHAYAHRTHAVITQPVPISESSASMLMAPSHTVRPAAYSVTQASSSSSKGANLTLVPMAVRANNLMTTEQVKQASGKNNNAAMDSAELRERYLHPFLTTSAGGVWTFLGKTLIFPINNTTYYYDPQSRYKVFGVVGATLGDELRFAHNIDWQVGVSYYKESSTRVSGQLAQGVDAPTTSYYRYHYTVSSQQVFLENKISVGVARYYHPYFSFGLGESFNKAYQFSTTVSPYETYTPSFQGKTLANFAWTLGAGVDADITDHVRLGVGYRFDYLGPVTLERAQLITQVQTINVPYRLKQPVWRMNTLLAQLTYIM